MKRGWAQGQGLDVSGDLEQWARQLAMDVESVVAVHPDANADDVRRTLIYLQMPPVDRLNRSLLRGRGFAAFRIRA